MDVAFGLTNPSLADPHHASTVVRGACQPVSFRAPLGSPLAWQVALVPTAWGTCGVAWKHYTEAGSPCTDATLCRIITPGLAIPRLRQALFASYPAATEVFTDAKGHFHPDLVPVWFGELVGYLQNYFDNSLHHASQVWVDVWKTWEPRLDLSGLSDFQRQVLEIVAQIPCGQCLTYGQVARLAGRPRAARAVGMALSKNPFPVLIPCHRVVGASGALTGFTAPGGIAAKRRMLAMEKGRS